MKEYLDCTAVSKSARHNHDEPTSPEPADPLTWAESCCQYTCGRGIRVWTYLILFSLSWALTRVRGALLGLGRLKAEHVVSISDRNNDCQNRNGSMC